jgi:LacI family transcriptional regulator
LRGLVIQKNKTEALFKRPSGTICILFLILSDSNNIETKMMLSSGIRATAIFALSNMILLGVVKALKEHKLNIPNDISIISFDDNLYLDYLDPPITRVVQPIEEIGMIAVKMLMQKITDNKDLNFEILLEPTIIKRKSIKLMVK